MFVGYIPTLSLPTPSQASRPRRYHPAHFLTHSIHGLLAPECFCRGACSNPSPTYGYGTKGRTFTLQRKSSVTWVGFWFVNGGVKAFPPSCRYRFWTSPYRSGERMTRTGCARLTSTRGFCCPLRLRSKFWNGQGVYNEGISKCSTAVWTDQDYRINWGSGTSTSSGSTTHSLRPT